MKNGNNLERIWRWKIYSFVYIGLIFDYLRHVIVGLSYTFKSVKSTNKFKQNYLYVHLRGCVSV